MIDVDDFCERLHVAEFGPYFKGEAREWSLKFRRECEQGWRPAPLPVQGEVRLVSNARGKPPKPVAIGVMPVPMA